MFYVNHIYKMENPIKDYPWGSHTAINEFYNISNINDQPQAEMWMGCHPNGSSQLIDAENNKINIDDFINQAPKTVLGDAFNKFGEIPFLFKVLAADKPLSIQVHPSKIRAEEGYAAENLAGIPVSSPNRNFKDPNHKPELVFAVTPFNALNGFRPFNDIVELFNGLVLAPLQNEIAGFKQLPSGDTLRVLFEALLILEGEAKKAAIAELLTYAANQTSLVFETIKQLAAVYPDDMGIFSPLLLNVVKLNPGEAMFLYAETPHAYLQGLALEVMANSDNVLRAGLTPKYIDIDALISNIRFDVTEPENILMQPEVSGNQAEYPIPVQDFSFSILTNESSLNENIHMTSASVLFCEHGQFEVACAQNAVTVEKGESVFVPASASTISVTGSGRVMWVSST